MNKLRILNGILLSLIFLNCNNQKKTPDEKECKIIYNTIGNGKSLNSNLNGRKIENLSYIQLKKNAKYIADSLKKIQQLAIYADTLIDINGDKFKDLILESYAESGFGIKYLHTIFLFDPLSDCYAKVIDQTPNFGFNPKSKTFTTTYFGEEIIQGEKYRWQGTKFSLIETATHHFSLDKKNAIEWCYIKKYSENKSIKKEACPDCFPKEYLNYINLKKQ
ncbi:XAC2610-related protein [Aureispira sp. CCB-E]|uniref:XAC2610-related protein n=1 Tax=Aureispira sp. CCB-E TaxID=3051121 RepID=UPI0028685F53|nr:hypothetical protein [Aureispira sp. CCB-E]WMX12366.1 hypothetical protein QP953_16170 [Aureispira sp. CCB-E]